MAYDPEADEATYELLLNDEEITLTRWNTSEFTFLGDLAIYNHIFIITLDTEEEHQGWYMFNTAEDYKDVVKFVSDNDFPRYLNQLEVPMPDLKAWYHHYLADLLVEDSFPEEWA